MDYKDAERIIELLEEISRKLDTPSYILHSQPLQSPKGCPVCGIGADGQPYGYVCNRTDCPSRIYCNTADSVQEQE